MSDLSNITVNTIVKIANNHRFVKRTVERLTKTLIIADGQKFNRISGRMVNSDVWSSSYLTIWNDDDEAEFTILKQVLRNRKILKLISNLDPEELSKDDYDILRQIIDNNPK